MVSFFFFCRGNNFSFCQRAVLGGAIRYFDDHCFLGSSGLSFRVRFCRKQYRQPDVFYEFYCIPFRKNIASSMR